MIALDGLKIHGDRCVTSMRPVSALLPHSSLRLMVGSDSSSRAGLVPAGALPLMLSESPSACMTTLTASGPAGARPAAALSIGTGPCRHAFNQGRPLPGRYSSWTATVVVLCLVPQLRAFQERHSFTV